MEPSYTSRGKKIVDLILLKNKSSTVHKDENCEKEDDNKQSDHNIEDSEPEFDDSDLDKDYVPNSEPSTSDDEYSRPSTSKVRDVLITREEATNQKAKAIESEEIIPDFLHNDLYLSIEDETNFDKTISSTNISQRKVKNKTVIVQKGKKRVRNEDAWMCNIRKKKLAAGEEYINKKGNSIAAKVMRPPCHCRSKCYEKLTQENRLAIFKTYWDKEKSSNTKRQFILSCLNVCPIERSRKRQGNCKKEKKNTLSFYFTLEGIKIKVCKVMFLNTLCISNTVVVNCLKNQKPGGAVKTDERGKNSPVNKTPDQIIQNVIQHISSFPNYESHYCRERTQYKYLGPELNKEKMYNLYLQFCKENNISEEFLAKKWVYFDVFDKHFKLSFKPPEVDTCDVCDSFQARLKDNSFSETEKTTLESEYESHLAESKKRYELKSEDTKMSKTSRTHKVLTGDLQKCLPTPLLTNALSFYKRKLWTLNYTLFDSSDKSVHCMMWDESKAGRGGEEISSAILKWADNIIPTSEVNEITIWSDNCYGQNKNIGIIMCFYWIMHKYPQIKCVNLKYLLKGHTHMEADTIHALIERNRKKINNLTILTPWDWQQMVRMCSSKFHVHNMEQNDFKQFNTLHSGKCAPFIYRKKNIEKDKVLISSAVHIQLRQESIGMLYLKSSFDSDFSTVNLNRQLRKSARSEEEKFPVNLPVKTPVPISQQKYNDLMSLLPFVPSVCHDFYKNLIKGNDKTQDYPASDESDGED